MKIPLLFLITILFCLGSKGQSMGVNDSAAPVPHALLKELELSPFQKKVLIKLIVDYRREKAAVDKTNPELYEQMMQDIKRKFRRQLRDVLTRSQLRTVIRWQKLRRTRLL